MVVTRPSCQPLLCICVEHLTNERLVLSTLFNGSLRTSVMMLTWRESAGHWPYVVMFCRRFVCYDGDVKATLFKARAVWGQVTLKIRPMLCVFNLIMGVVGTANARELPSLCVECVTVPIGLYGIFGSTLLAVCLSIGTEFIWVLETQFIM